MLVVAVMGDQLETRVRDLAEALAVPGVAAGLHHAGRERYVFHGVTSVENPLPVDAETLFQLGSTGKTFTATALMLLVEQGRVELDAPVRRYLPELRLRDEEAERTVTVLQLLNHTAGWAGDLNVDTGEGDDALARFVEAMADLEQVTTPGSAVSYNNASLSVAGLVIERLTGTTFEQAVRELLFEPLGLAHSFFFANEVMTRRFAAGHHPGPDGSPAVARPWAFPRGGAPAGGISANAGDLVAWARFHLGDGRAADGTPVLSAELLRSMQRPTVSTGGNALGDHVGIAWFLRDAGGLRLVGHDGGTNGQETKLLLVPERDWAIAVLTNCAPNGLQLAEELARWALEADLGIEDADPEPVALPREVLTEYAGQYDSIGMSCRVTPQDGGLLFDPAYKPELLDQLREAGDEPAAALPPLPVGLLPGPGDRYVVTGGPLKGMKGSFGRGASGAVESLDAGGRLLARVPG